MPPGSDERQIGLIPNGHTTYSEKNNLRYLRLIRKYSSIIQGQFFGHLHSDSFRIVYNDMGKTRIPFYVQMLFIASHHRRLLKYKFFICQLFNPTREFCFLLLVSLRHRKTCELDHDSSVYYSKANARWIKQPSHATLQI